MESKDKVYYFDTINECEKAIAKIAGDVDIAFSSNSALFNCFARFIRTAYIWIMLISAIYVVWTKNKGFITSYHFLFIISIYIAAAIISSWTRFNYEKEYTNAKINVTRNLISACKEYCELKCDPWERKVIYERMVKFANLEVTWRYDEE
jgi:hypothetical protein